VLDYDKKPELYTKVTYSFKDFHINKVRAHGDRSYAWGGTLVPTTI
jgi:hypothetical protein